MMNFEIKNNDLILSGFSENGLSFSDMEKNYEEFCSTVSKNRTASVSIDLKNVDSRVYSALSFIISIGQHCSEKGMKIYFTGLVDDKIKDTLRNIGFDLEGNYKAKSFREHEARPLFELIGNGIFGFFKNTRKFVGFTGELVESVFYCIRHPGKLERGEAWYYMEKSGSDAVPIVILICFLVGLILAFQGIMQMARFGISVYVADLVAIAMVREMGPLMVAVICIGRAGSAYAAELGTMNAAEEIDAMITMGLKPTRSLVLPKIIALTIMVPLLVMVGDLAGIIGGVTISIPMGDFTFIQYWNRTIAALIPANLLESIVKGIVFAIIIAIVGCYRGMYADKDAKGVGKATTSAVVTSILFVIIADFFITLTFPQVMHLFGINY